MDTDYYRSLAYDQLNDTSFYSEIPNKLDSRIMRRLKNLVLVHTTSLTEKEGDCLTNFKYNTSYFYGLPKVHKSKQKLKQRWKNKTANMSF